MFWNLRSHYICKWAVVFISLMTCDGSKSCKVPQTFTMCFDQLRVNLLGFHPSSLFKICSRQKLKITPIIHGGGSLEISSSSLKICICVIMSMNPLELLSLSSLVFHDNGMEQVHMVIVLTWNFSTLYHLHFSTKFNKEACNRRAFRSRYQHSSKHHQNSKISSRKCVSNFLGFLASKQENFTSF